MSDKKHIGIDLDNTLIDYEAVFRAFARDCNLVSPGFVGGKEEIRAAVRARQDGDIAWQRLQGAVYSRGIAQAVLFEGAGEFLRRAREQGSEIFIVSHKTEYGHFDPHRINLRTAALEWMEAQGFFRADGFTIPQRNVLFTSTRCEKISVIGRLGLNVFIDDLPEVLKDDNFPADIEGLLFSRSENTMSDYPLVFTHWHLITEMVFG